MHPVTAKLVELRQVESMLDSGPAADAEKQLSVRAKQLRADIPPQVLAHYDRIAAQGKTPIVPVINGACRGCYLRLSTSAQARLLNKDDIHLCENCGRYVYLAKPAVAPEPPAAPKKPRARSRGRVASVRS